LTFPCISHQTNLLVKSITKHAFFTTFLSNFLSVVSHFRKSNLALAKLRELSFNQSLRFQHPCITRWTTYTKTAEQVLKAKDNIRVWIIFMFISTEYLFEMNYLFYTLLLTGNGNKKF
jgi:hypothetical protein